MNSNNDFRVTLDAVEPMELLRTPEAPGSIVPMKVWVRIVGAPARSPAGETPVEIRGAKEDVLSFIATNWSDEEEAYQRGYAAGYDAAVQEFATTD